ncbi:MAG TPA: LPS export ABC transporter periplasmic protein LptC [Candidatus Cloacimonetes bacterium]|nr:LPS export ABC transporter periplasmic protein LptC [Candidatus Cloacimonadota bacterium]HEX38213.1 LPS export ABC transporter periplasmic protein LptC [Candidatus Cloacimonadota bacterium]
MYKVLLVLLIIPLISCSKSDGQISFEDIGKDAIEITDSIMVYSSSKEMTLWTLYADRLIKYPKKDIMNLSNIVLKLMEKDGSLGATIYADSAQVNEDQETIYAEGNIKIYSKEGDIFGKSIIWDRKKDEILSDDSVMVIKDGNIIKGDSFYSDSRFHHVTLHKATGEGELGETEVLW